MVDLANHDLLHASVDGPPRGDARSATTPTPTRGSSGHLRVLGSTGAVAVASTLSGCEVGFGGTERTTTELNSWRRASMKVSLRCGSRCDRAGDEDEDQRLFMRSVPSFIAMSIRVIHA